MAFLTPRGAQSDPFFARYPANDLATFFRLLDSDDAPPSRSGHGGSIASFTPRFDIRDAKEAYLVSGEVPGIEQKDISIEFTDHNTLVISGRTVHEHHEGGDEGHGDKGKAKTPTVEDEPEGGKQADKQVANTKGQDKQVSKHAKQPHYIIRERSVGEFRRSFTFPGKIDQDNVKASLKNGILNVSVPKSTFAKKSITVE